MKNIISLGAGVQSSTMALMSACGELPPVDAAIFADTQGEPQEVYDWLDYLMPLLPFPVHIVSNGNLRDDFLKALKDPDGRCGQPPFMVWNHQKNKGARLWRKCTQEYKLQPIRRKTREIADGGTVKQWIGITTDEAHRMKPSGVKYIENIFPLVDRRMSRDDCLQWMKKNGFDRPPKSACYYCPYINNSRLRDMKLNQQDEWQKLVWLDEEMRRLQGSVINGAKITGTLYIHRDCKPLSEIDLRNAADFGQQDLFGEECEGMCGV